MFDRELLGNVGVRYAKTEVEGSGVIGTVPVTAENEYDDTAPSLNLSYQVVPHLLLCIAAAKVIADVRQYRQSILAGAARAVVIAAGLLVC